MMQIISVSWVPTYLIRAYDAPLADVGFLFGNALLVACIGTLAAPMIAERLALRGRKDDVFPVLLVAIPAAALCLIGAIRAPRLFWAGGRHGAFHPTPHGANVLPSNALSSNDRHTNT